MLALLLNWLLSCSHHRTTFPQTWAGETHVTCLDCGKQLKYDWEGL